MSNQVNVLDKGFVQMVEHMGGDRAVVQAARVSYQSDGHKTPEEDRKLIAYLLKHRHGTPFEQAVFKFHVRCPIFVMRQWIRHRMSSYNEISARYSEMKDDFYIPVQWRAQDTRNKQGSLTADFNHEVLSYGVDQFCQESFKFYQGLLEKGVAKEMARMVLPLNLYTEFYWTVNARALMHFIELRSEAHAQWEIRQYSDALFSFLCQEMPWTARSFFWTLDRTRYPGDFFQTEETNA